jgi:hypothetical protein
MAPLAVPFFLLQLRIQFALFTFYCCLSGATGYSVAYKLVGSLHANHVSTEALRNQMQADMMHDALRADVFAAAFDALQDGQPHKADVRRGGGLSRIPARPGGAAERIRQRVHAAGR